MLSKIFRLPSRRCIFKQFSFGLYSTNSKGSEESEEDEFCEPKIPDNPREIVKLYDPLYKVALVSGGTSGIGFATGIELLCAGAKHVALIGLDECQGNDAACMLRCTFGAKKSSFVKADVTNTQELEDAFKKIQKEQGKIDIFVNTAAILNGKKWEQEFKTNVLGTIKSNLLALKYIGKQEGGPGGCIVNFSGVPGGLEELHAAPTISACWHAILGFSRSFGHDFHMKPAEMRVLTLCPGFTQTHFCRNIVAKGMTKAMGEELEIISKKCKKQKPDVCGRAVLHLIKHAKSGSVWWIEGSKLYSLEFPDKVCYSTLEAQYL